MREDQSTDDPDIVARVVPIVAMWAGQWAESGC